jgi:ribosomal protein S18
MKKIFTVLFVVIVVLSANVSKAQYNLVIQSTKKTNIFLSLNIIEENKAIKLKLYGVIQTSESDSTKSELKLDSAKFQESKIPLYDYENYFTFKNFISNDIINFKELNVDSEYLKTTEYEEQIKNIHSKFLEDKLPLQLFADEKIAGYIEINKEAQLKKVEDTNSKYNFDKYEVTNAILKINNVSFTISDNYISKIVINGTVTIDSKEISVQIINNRWSLSLKKFYNQSVSFSINDTWFSVQYKDIFTFKPDEATGNYNYYVKDDIFILEPGKKHYLITRGLNEYFNVQVFSNFITEDNEIDPNFVNTNFNAYLPLNVNQRKLTYWFSNLSLNLKLLNLTSNKESNYQELFIDSISHTDTSFYYLDIFDLVRYQNHHFSSNLSIVAWEIKGLNTFIHLGSGFDVYKSGFKLTKIDSGLDTVNLYDLFSIAPFFKLTARYKPDLFFGADFSLKIKQQYLNNSSNNIPRIIESSGIYHSTYYINNKKFNEISKNISKQRLIYSLEFNLYTHINKAGKNGIFFTFLYDWYTPYSSNKSSFCRFYIGYSTNLASYIGSIQK